MKSGSACCARAGVAKQKSPKYRNIFLTVRSKWHRTSPELDRGATPYRSSNSTGAFLDLRVNDGPTGNDPLGPKTDSSSRCRFPDGQFPGSVSRIGLSTADNRILTSVKSTQ